MKRDKFGKECGGVGGGDDGGAFLGVTTDIRLFGTFRFRRRHFSVHIPPIPSIPPAQQCLYCSKP
jgi:hypothetical protein